LRRSSSSEHSTSERKRRTPDSHDAASTLGIKEEGEYDDLQVADIENQFSIYVVSSRISYQIIFMLQFL